MAETVVPPFRLDDNKGSAVLGIVSFFFSLATISVFLRLYVRLKNHAHGWDDYFLYASWFMAIYCQVAVVFLAKYGMGRHYEYVLPTLSNLIETFIVAEIGTTIAIGLVRVSICLFVLRLIQRTHPRTRIALYIILCLNSVVTLVALFALWFQCRPLRKAWNFTIEGTCVTQEILENITRVVGAFGCLTDFMCVAVPFFILKDLQMSKGTKWSIILVMSLALFTAACSIGKIATVYVRSDFSWNAVDVEVWSALELLLGIIVANLPPLRPLLVTAHQRMRNQWRSYYCKDQPTKDTSVRPHDFAGQERTFERLEFDFDEPVTRQASKV